MDYQIISQDQKRLLVLPQLTQLGLHHCFTTRDMDMGMKTNPSIAEIKENLDVINKSLGITPKLLFTGLQTHSKNIKSVLEFKQGETNQLGRFFPNTDGLITDLEGGQLMTTYADCTPIILFDPVKRVHGNIHSGWKGTLQRIGQEAVNQMRADYDCQLEDIIAVIGPSIGKDDFEVEADVMDQFKNTFDFYKEISARKNKIKYLIDIQETNRRILLESGIKGENIAVIDLSTMADPMFHSYRRDGEDYGLMGCVTCLVSP